MRNIIEQPFELQPVCKPEVRSIYINPVSDETWFPLFAVALNIDDPRFISYYQDCAPSDTEQAPFGVAGSAMANVFEFACISAGGGLRGCSWTGWHQSRLP